MTSPTRTPRHFAVYAASSELILKLPHPYQTAYHVEKTEDDKSYQLTPRDPEPGSKPLPTPLHSTAVSFSEPQDLKSSDRPSESNNTPWARARRNPAVTVRWTSAQPPTVGQLWLITYAVFTVRPGEEAFRLDAQGPGADRLAQQLKTVGLAINHPTPRTSSSSAASKEETTTTTTVTELLLSRGAFWQGAGSPFGSRPAWAPPEHGQDPSSAYPLPPPEYVMTTDEPTTTTDSDDPTTTTSFSCWHPRRRAKPAPGSVVYSRYIPHLRETFSMVALDWTDPTHVELFHAWQNDPRVSQGWDVTGRSRDQHRAYLRRAHEDPHRVAVLGRFDETFFAYFEVYWAKEDRIGAYYHAGDYDRGRHSLVGDVRYRGPHRVSAWWSSLMHYLFLDEPRTARVVGEPKYTHTSVLMYDLIHGFGLDKFIDLPEKRSALVSCSRERFFQLCPLDDNDKVMGGTGVGLVPKL
ncbi:acyl-CoA N-acyltransferase [Chaetomidium leptoderma]|uniref:Acyl-CoA N-acyltransferase n=1 Tax=Chaetomidium leptoderma TaxID=669021 RepID=A0AAN6VIJ4_9PEZI|nr:acyl-CoA N-acyltransferase [Chaetomidium leptoderma]